MERKIGKTKKRTPAKKPVVRRKRRVSGIGNADVMQIVQVVGGAIGGRILGNVAAKTFVGTSNYLINGGQVAIGYFLPKFIKKPWAKNVGLGMIVTGATAAVVNAGFISGIDGRAKYTVRKRQINGPGLVNLNTINGPGLSNLNTINGYNNDWPARPMSVNGVAGSVRNAVQRGIMKARTAA